MLASMWIIWMVDVFASMSKSKLHSLVISVRFFVLIGALKYLLWVVGVC